MKREGIITISAKVSFGLKVKGLVILTHTQPSRHYGKITKQKLFLRVCCSTKQVFTKYRVIGKSILVSREGLIWKGTSEGEQEAPSYFSDQLLLSSSSKKHSAKVDQIQGCSTC